MQKLKNLSLNILRICALYYLKEHFLIFIVGILLFINTLLFYAMLHIENSYFYNAIFWILRFIYLFLEFFIAKKLGLIKIIDNLSFFKALTFILFIEIILSYSSPKNIYDISTIEFIIKNYKTIISNTFTHILLGFGWIYPIIAYKTIKLLTTKYPNKFNWILKLYPKKLDEIITFNNFKKIIYKLIINPTKKAIKWLKDNYRPY